jgi:hypothetical protein
MSEKVMFAGFDPMHFDSPRQCDLCASQPPVFRYEHSTDESARRSPKKGFCCCECAADLLADLKQAEAEAWAEEAALMKAEG